jgi:hypothetical protein
MGYKLRILSLGAGVQSSTLLLMAEKGVIAPFDCAIFADTGWEGRITYEWLDWLKQVCKTPIITVQGPRGSIYDWSMSLRARSGTAASLEGLPYFTERDGSKGMLRRQCTDHFKIRPIHRETRRLLGLVPRQHAPKDCVEQALGISLDEAQRVRTSRERMTFLSFPLVKMGMTRQDCINWLARNKYPVPPKSSCIGCPFHKNDEWRAVRGTDPAGWKQAVSLDNTIRQAGISDGRLSSFLYLHSSRRPLEEVDLSTPEERGQGAFDFVKDEKLNLFVNQSSIAVVQ